MSQNHPQLEGVNLNLMLALYWLLVEQSVTRAAQRMGVTQSAMSRSLAQLRHLFDDALFVTVGRGLEPTPRASALREPLATAMATMRGLLRHGESFEPARVEGVFRMAATEHAMVLLQPLLAALRKAAPGLTIQVEPANVDVFSLLAAGRIELFIGPKIGSSPKGLVARSLLCEDFVAVLRRGNPAAKQELTLRRYCALEHVVVAPVGGERQSLVSRALTQRGLDRRVVLRVPYFSSAIDIVAASDLVLTLPALLAPRRLAIRRPPLRLPGFVIEAVWPQRLGDGELHRWVRNTLWTIAEAPRLNPTR